MTILIKTVRVLIKALLGEGSARELSQGFALGVLIGLVPKGNLTAVALGVILAASRANLGVAAATAFIFSFVSPLFDPVFHAVGSFVLQQPSLIGIWTKAYNTPLMPWTDLNNSVVLGSFMVGLAVTYPAYKASKPVFRKYSETVSEWAKKYWLTRVLLGAEWADRLTLSGE